MLIAVVLTKNEQIHIRRCLESIAQVVDKILVVDSGSTDKTLEICSEYGAEIVFHKWKNYSDQFNFGIYKAKRIGAQYILRIDADEYLDSELIGAIKDLELNAFCLSGFYVKRHIKFFGKMIKFGGATPISVIRLFRADKGYCEERWMDEHIIVNGDTGCLAGRLIDDSNKDINWWINKHLRYAERECVDILISDTDSVALINPSSNHIKRFFKYYIYNRLPIGLRPCLYFLYRYVIRLGFLDGFCGFLFHFLQGFWYRVIVDYKVYQVRELQRENSLSTKQAVKQLYNLEI